MFAVRDNDKEVERRGFNVCKGHSVWGLPDEPGCQDQADSEDTGQRDRERGFLRAKHLDTSSLPLLMFLCASC